MKKRLLTIAMLGLAFYGFSQNDLKSTIKGESGITKQFTRFSSTQQVVFSPSNASKLFGFDAQSSLVLKSTETDNLGIVHYRYYQTWKGIPINRSMYIVNVKKGKLESATGSVVTDFSTDMAKRNSAKISAKQAVTNAINYVGASKYVWQIPAMENNLKSIMKNASATYYPVAEKCWYNPGDEINPENLILAYKVDIFAEEPFSRAYYFVDASTGKIIGREDRIETSNSTGTANTVYSGTQTITSEKTGANAYRLHDLTRGDGVITLHGNSGQNGVDYTNMSANWNLTLPDQNALDAHWGVEKTYDFYKAVFNRNSVDGKGYALYSYVNRGGFLYSNNASWDGTAMNYGKRSGAGNDNGKGVTAIDVTGHELTHGVTQNTSGLVYSGESGGMNESMSDIMGKSVQFFTKPNDINWQLSNDMNWIIRDMSNPNAYQQPDTYGGKYWGAHADVHVTSGVGNFMYYLLVTGGSGTNDLGNAYTVQGIGINKAEQIIYRTETVYLTPNSKYADWRTACINAATDLYGASSNEVNQVQNAWYAVGIGSPGGGIVYCTSEGLSTANEFINSISFAGINNVSGNNNGYGDFTEMTGNVVAGQSYKIKGQAGYPGATRKEFWTVYIDYNQDGDFDDAGENVGTGSTSTSASVSKTFQISPSAKTGTTRMRIQMNYNAAVTDPCATLNNGEVEDYSLNISGGSGITAYSEGQESDLKSLSVSPNPVNTSFVKLDYILSSAGNISFRLTDANGLTKGSYKAGIQDKGHNSFVLNNLSALRNGYYYVSVEQDGKIIGKETILVAH